MMMPYRFKSTPVTALWYPFFICAPTDIEFFIYSAFLHVLPAAIVDMSLKMIAKKAKLLQLYRQVQVLATVLRFFTSKSFKFENSNMKRVSNK